MNGADALISTLVDNGVSACFANPGTSEMQFVAALDREPRMRPVLCLFEGVATGAADGYGRMAGKPACTLLHLGPGYGNGVANLHNARRACTPIVNVIGDHATYHRQYDAPLTSDIAALAGPTRVWVKSADSAGRRRPTSPPRRCAASFGPPGGSASLILPADCAWSPATRKGPTLGRAGAGRGRPARRSTPPAKAIARRDQAGAADGRAGLRRGRPRRRRAARGRRRARCSPTPSSPASRAAPAASRPTGCCTSARWRWHDLDGVDLMVLAGTTAAGGLLRLSRPRPACWCPRAARRSRLAERGEDGAAGAGRPGRRAGRARARPQPSALQPARRRAQRRARRLHRRRLDRPPHAGGRDRLATTRSPPARRSSAATTTRAAARLAGPDRRRHRPGHPGGGRRGGGLRRTARCSSLNGDGAAMYTVQGLWTLARENLDVTVVVFANHTYRILGIELGRTGAGAAGPGGRQPARASAIRRIDWVSARQGPGRRRRALRDRRSASTTPSPRAMASRARC